MHANSTLRIFDPPPYCAAPTSVELAESIEWLVAIGVRVERYDLLNHPHAFLGEELVRSAVIAAGIETLPMVVVGGTVLARRGYPSREALISALRLVPAVAIECKPDLGVFVSER
jgi:hypothetical protein